MGCKDGRRIDGRKKWTQDKHHWEETGNTRSAWNARKENASMDEGGGHRISITGKRQDGTDNEADYEGG